MELPVCRGFIVKTVKDPFSGVFPSGEINVIVLEVITVTKRAIFPRNTVTYASMKVWLVKIVRKKCRGDS